MHDGVRIAAHPVAFQPASGVWLQSEGPWHVDPALAVARIRPRLAEVIGRLLQRRADLAGTASKVLHEQRRQARDGAAALVPTAPLMKVPVVQTLFV